MNNPTTEFASGDAQVADLTKRVADKQEDPEEDALVLCCERWGRDERRPWSRHND